MAGRHYIEQHTGAIVRMVRAGARLADVAVTRADRAVGQSVAGHAVEIMRTKLTDALDARWARRQKKADELTDYPLQQAIAAMAARREAGQPRTLSGWRF